MDPGQGWVQFRGAAQGRDRLLATSQGREHQPSRPQGEGGARVQLQGAVQGRQRLLGPADHSQRLAQLGVGPGQVRVQLCGAVQGRDRLLPAAQGAEHVPPGPQGVGVARVQLQGAVQGHQRLVVATEGVQDGAAEPEGLVVIGSQGQREVDGLEGLRREVGRAQDAGRLQVGVDRRLGPALALVVPAQVEGDLLARVAPALGLLQGAGGVLDAPEPVEGDAIVPEGLVTGVARARQAPVEEVHRAAEVGLGVLVAPDSPANPPAEGQGHGEEQLGPGRGVGPGRAP